MIICNETGVTSLIWSRYHLAIILGLIYLRSGARHNTTCTIAKKPFNRESHCFINGIHVEIPQTYETCYVHRAPSRSVSFVAGSRNYYTTTASWYSINHLFHQSNAFLMGSLLLYRVHHKRQRRLSVGYVGKLIIDHTFWPFFRPGRLMAILFPAMHACACWIGTTDRPFPLLLLHRATF